MIVYLIKKTQKYLLFVLISTIQPAILYGEIIITELMVNPTNGKLPPHEYIELYNKGNKAINLKGYTLTINNKLINLPDIYLSSKQFVILSDLNSSSTFERFGNTIPISNWQKLNNNQGSLKIYSPTSVTTDSLTYDSTWYRNNSKRSGGWSLERINPNINCNESSNWIASESPMGGTPGERNSVWNENYWPQLQVTSSSVSGNTIFLQFNLSIDFLDEINNIQPIIEPADIKIVDLVLENNTLKLISSKEIPSNRLYQVYLNNIYWCHGTQNITAPIFLTSPPSFNDVIINEVLFNPKQGGADFVEIYNRSGRSINLQNWFLNKKPLTDQFLLLDIDDFLVFTTNSESTINHYPNAIADKIIQIPSLPNYTNEQGEVILNYQQQTIDSLYYTSKMHQPLLNNPKGFSLERQDYNQPTNGFGNFTSASALSGGATPGYINSKNTVEIVSKNNVYLLSRSFSPNGDGFEDSLEIRYEFNVKNPMLNISIFNDKGRLVNRLIRNKSSGNKGSINWDGLHENGSLCGPGIYIMKAEVYTAEGYTKAYKSSFLLVNVK
ncbi:lamin tail domain-containing protein [Sphingobacterium sp. UT-1RO-CII-1]|uniref:lamin tail domain-containing protein n=1 Tax=Sphingobacterium sp. UT-1RO-CII-1 TaxID=2995225 RepID=UPI00227B56A7|nr:lamin tail domain-containing protein [Sphingobacterium sp. UT-1RO-CII-1]MCY4780905.1 lamin tail domain-containing protein [Sphingobacterium sp. UT-1RO-CII-1]